MSEDTKPAGRRPEHIAYNVQEGKDGKGYFQRVGAGWDHKDGKGIDVVLESTPVSGRITLREQRDDAIDDLREQEAQQVQESPPTRSRSRSR